jgi:hypothetical protein
VLKLLKPVTTAFGHYYAEQFPILKGHIKYIRLPGPEIIKQIVKNWYRLPESKKIPYKQMEESETMKYKEYIDEYNEEVMKNDIKMLNEGKEIPDQPITGFNYYEYENYNALRDKYPQLQTYEIHDKLVDGWDSLSETEKDCYLELERYGVEKYKTELIDYAQMMGLKVPEID